MSLTSGLSKAAAASAASSSSNANASATASRAPNLMQLAMMATAQARAAATSHHDADSASAQAATSAMTTSGTAQDRIMQLFAAFSHLGSLGGQSASSSTHLTADRIRLALDTYLDPPADARARHTATAAATATAATTTAAPAWPWPQWEDDGEPPMELVRDIIQSIDLNGDGKIQFNEFLKMMEAEEERRQNKLEQQRAQVAEQLREQLALSGGAGGAGGANSSAEPTSAELAIAAKEATAVVAAAAAGSGEARGDGEGEGAAFQATRENIRTVFDAFDADKDGLLSLTEVGAVFRQHCTEDEIVTEEQLKMLVRLLDPSANGFITFPTFTRLMLAEDL